jgi:WhiB family redox-sensing transcriptional regulator
LAVRIFATEPTEIERRNPNWRADAVCRMHDPEIWFPISAADTRTVTLAKDICWTCPVVAECSAWSLRDRDLHGVFAGRLLPQEHPRRDDPQRRRRAT